MRQALLYGLLTLALAQATPTWKGASTIAKRGTPEPSHYPGGDTDECANEPLYLNFDITKSEDLKRVQKLHKAFCDEFDVLIIAGSTATNDGDRTIYEKFFPESDDEDDNQAQVNDIWNKLFDFQAETASTLIASFIIDNNDWQKLCGETQGADLSPDSEALAQAAYTDIDGADGREKTHFCVTALEYIDLADITCYTLDTYPSAQMDSTGRFMLHEFTHYTTVGPDSLLDDQIIDAKNKDRIWAYEASRSHGLIDPNQDDQPAIAMINADNYAWISTNSYFKQTCKAAGQEGPNNGNYNDPPNYIPGQEGDPSSSGFGDNPGDDGCGSTNAPGCNGTPDDDTTYIGTPT